MATYYVRPVNGLDTNGGTSYAAAFKTTQKAADTATAGDTVYLCAEAVETTATQIDFDINSGTNGGNRVRFIAASSAGVVDGSTYTIRASAAITAVAAIGSAGLAITYLDFRRVVFDANSQATYAVNIVNNLSLDNRFRRCYFINATSHGTQSNQTGPNVYVNCEAYGNGGDGIGSAANRGQFVVLGGVFRNNGGCGIFSKRSEMVVHGTHCYSNTSHGICGPQTTYGESDLTFNTCYGNGGDGIRVDAATVAPVNVHSNSCVNNTGYGINAPTIAYARFLWDHNHTHGNTSGASNITLPGDENITGDPLFVDAAGGDFTPGSGSPLIAAGLGGKTIGAEDPLTGGGGASVYNPFHSPYQFGILS